jgi:hypothetical protein
VQQLLAVAAHSPPFARWNFLPFMCFLTASTDLSINCPVSAQYSISLHSTAQHSTAWYTSAQQSNVRRAARPVGLRMLLETHHKTQAVPPAAPSLAVP